MGVDFGQKNVTVRKFFSFLLQEYVYYFLLERAIVTSLCNTLLAL